MRVIQYQCTEWLCKIVLFDPGSIQGSHRPISFMIKHRKQADDILRKTENNHIVGLVHKNQNTRTCLMYHAACKVEFNHSNRSYSQLTFFNFLRKYTRISFKLKNVSCGYNRLNGKRQL